MSNEEVRAVISNAYYDARNAGQTMEQAADDAAERVEAIIADAWQIALLDLRNRVNERLPHKYAARVNYEITMTPNPYTERRAP